MSLDQLPRKPANTSSSKRTSEQIISDLCGRLVVEGRRLITAPWARCALGEEKSLSLVSLEYAIVNRLFHSLVRGRVTQRYRWPLSGSIIQVLPCYTQRISQSYIHDFQPSVLTLLPHTKNQLPPAEMEPRRSTFCIPDVLLFFNFLCCTTSNASFLATNLKLHGVEIAILLKAKFLLN